MEGLFAHFFHPHRQQYHPDDCRWFLELANEQEQWRGDLLERTVISSSLSQDILTEFEKSLHQHPHPHTTEVRGQTAHTVSVARPACQCDGNRVYTLARILAL